MSTIPTNDQIEAFLVKEIRLAPDLTLLSRKSLKDSLFKHFKLGDEEKTGLENDKEKKAFIRRIIAEAVEARQRREAGQDNDQEESHPKSDKSKKGDSKGSKALKRPQEARKISDGTPHSVMNSKDSKEEEKRENEAEVSEFSSLEDEEPSNQKGKRGDGSQTSKKPKKRKRQSTTTADSSSSTLKGSEEQLQKFKAYVLQCGTRKNWKKLYEEAGCPDLSPEHLDSLKEKDRRDLKFRQTEVVKGILRELGMEGRPSKEKAKKIKEGKEFKEELEAIRQAGTTQRAGTRSGGRRRAKDDEGVETEESEEEQPVPRKTFNTSLTAFAAELND